jgi:hypothetical protein
MKHLSDIEREIYEDTVALGNNSSTSGTQNGTWSEAQYPWNSGDVHPFTEGPRGLRM